MKKACDLAGIYRTDVWATALFYPIAGEGSISTDPVNKARNKIASVVGLFVFMVLSYLSKTSVRRPTAVGFLKFA